MPQKALEFFLNLLNAVSLSYLSDVKMDTK